MGTVNLLACVPRFESQGRRGAGGTISGPVSFGSPLLCMAWPGVSVGRLWAVRGQPSTTNNGQ